MIYGNVHSRYKKILRDDRHQLKPDNISKILVTKCFYARFDEEELNQKKALELVRKEYTSYTHKKK